MFDNRNDGTGVGALLFAMGCLFIAVVSFTIAIVCGGIYSAANSLLSFANGKLTKGVLWAGPALLVGNAFLIHTADETWTRMCLGWLIAIPVAAAVDFARLVRGNMAPQLPAPEPQSLAAGSE
jgi:hypothetical protein